MLIRRKDIDWKQDINIFIEKENPPSLLIQSNNEKVSSQIIADAINSKLRTQKPIVFKKSKNGDVIKVICLNENVCANASSFKNYFIDFMSTHRQPSVYNWLELYYETSNENENLNESEIFIPQNDEFCPFPRLRSLLREKINNKKLKDRIAITTLNTGDNKNNPGYLLTTIQEGDHILPLYFALFECKRYHFEDYFADFNFTNNNTLHFNDTFLKSTILETFTTFIKQRDANIFSQLTANKDSINEGWHILALPEDVSPTLRTLFDEFKSIYQKNQKRSHSQAFFNNQKTENSKIENHNRMGIGFLTS